MDRELIIQTPHLIVSGVQRSWMRLQAGQCGIVSLAGRSKAHTQQQSQVAALVPDGKKKEGGWTADEWLTGHVRQISSNKVTSAWKAYGINKI